MNKQEAKEIFRKIRKQYNSIKYPKYRNVDLDQLKKQYNALQELNEFLMGDVTYNRLINAMSQIISKLSKEATWSNYSERGMNKVIPPVVKKGQTETVFPIEWTDKWGNKCYLSKGYWNARNYMVMDIVGYIFLLKAGGDKLPEGSNPIFDDLESIRSRESQLNQQLANREMLHKDNGVSGLPANTGEYSISFDDTNFRKFTGLSLSSNEILNLLLETSRVEFKLSFPVRVKSSGGKEEIHIMNYFSRFFELGYSDGKIREDGIIQLRKYRVKFNTTLGELFINNLKSRYNDKISNDFYLLPNSAQILYRRLLLHNNFKETHVNLSTIVEFLGYTDKNITNLIHTIENNVLEPLKDCGLIKSYTKKEGLKKTKYIIKRDFA